ncbi:uncharacterized protein LOC141601777 [Silene latifolia]|uniref:uncharacterized protein LOC141601777 n=1 Tax=Silene latifolia TaxID=37657 RepID=UPI003D77A78F
MYSYALRVSIDQAKHYKESNEKYYLIALSISSLKMGKVDQQLRLNEYESVRIARIAQNQVRLEQLGLRNLVQSSTSLVESSESKRRKHNRSGRTCHSDKDDLDYFSTKNEAEDDRVLAEVPKKVSKSGSRQRAQYIPPGSVTRYSNYSRLRNQGQANKHQQGFELQQPFDKDQARQRHDDASNVNLNPKNDVREMTMAELILKRNQLQRDEERSTDFHQPSHFTPTEGDNNMGVHYENSSQLERDQLIAECFGGDALTDSSSEGDNSDTSHSDEEEDPEDESEEINLDSRDLELAGKLIFVSCTFCLNNIYIVGKCVLNNSAIT